MMSQAYGYKFASQFGDEPNDVWIGALQGVSGEQIAAGLRKCSEIYPQWPPGAIEFKALCEGRDPRNFDKDGIDTSWEHKHREARQREYDEAMRRRNQLDLVDLTRKERAKEAGTKTLSSIKELFQ